ncbi:hypothetical protein Suden_0650 [Sulfurimonas denitrificans DSM 1251]|uniref:BatD n=1 Tax=Sulfurimonas denitrificans (strain ATCC 33889 / DSM 1251) TaxID=326298 RepID=Q30SV2_SULDN|nr:BatD family protein [Sulfurimonas denitrificans]ABB43929.1 hypothetical protein Suden_0650 [Sulfurimonas denitrificans DSM 1251]MDD3443586.1 BatD family protein [Sulfurimonas denitrificans]
MKKNLGKIFLIATLFLQVSLFASTYEWSSFISKKSAYVNEAIYMKYECVFSDKAELYSIEFNPRGDYEGYRVEILRENSTIIDGKKINSYELVLFAKKAAEIDISFEAFMKKTTRESIEETVIGRDNFKKEQVVKERIKQQSFKVEIKETQTQLVGDFTLEVKKREPHVKAHEPYHLSITIKGLGDFEVIEPLVFEIAGVRVFAGEVALKKELSKDGIKGELSQKFAFVADKDFTIPKLEITYFSLKDEKEQKLVIEAIDVKVESGFVKEELLDKVDEKKWHFEISYLYYLLTFLAGFLVSKVKIKREPNMDNKDEIFYKKIDNVNSLDELMVLLVLENPKKYDSLIKDIEAARVTTLKEAKAICREFKRF